jgi:predicted outer membrane repeat protein
LVLTDFGPGGKGALTFVGAFDDCSDDTPSNNWTYMTGTASEPVVTVNTAGATSVVTFDRVALYGSGTDGLVISGNSTVTMNTAHSWSNGGSGIRITGSGAWLDLINGTSIDWNITDGFGGGIFCQNATVNLFWARIRSNSASSGGGGGIYASNCSLEVHPEGQISGNTAIDGGGIYADQGSSITIIGATHRWANVYNNTATDDGGAIYAKNAGTSVVVTNGDFRGNEAVNRGGVLFMGDGAQLIMNATKTGCSWLTFGSPTDPTRCSTMWSNSMSPGGLGIALYAASGSKSYLGNIFFEGNEGDESLIHAIGAGTEVYLEGHAFWNNPVRYLQAVEDDAFLSSAFISAAHNQYDASGIMTDAEVLMNAGGTVEMYSSVYQGGSFLGLGGLTGRCLMASNSTGMVESVEHFTLTSDPGFVDAAAGNLRLNPDSPAVDYCDDSAYTAFWNDTDMQPRGVDLPGNPNGSPGVSGGLFDLGFDELLPDLVFADRFED